MADQITGLVTAAWCGNYCPKFRVNDVVYGLSPSDTTAIFRWTLILQRMAANQPVTLETSGVVLGNPDAPETFPNCTLIT
jgi:hypothetical protein